MLRPIGLPAADTAARDLLAHCRLVVEEVINAMPPESQANVALRSQVEPLVLSVELMPRIVVSIWLGSDELAMLNLTAEQ